MGPCSMEMFMLDGGTSGVMKYSCSYKSTSHPRKGWDLVEGIMGYRGLCLKGILAVLFYMFQEQEHGYGKREGMGSQGGS